MDNYSHDASSSSGEEEEEDEEDETYEDEKKSKKKKATTTKRSKKTHKVSVTSAGKKPVPPLVKMLEDYRRAEIDVEKKKAKEKDNHNKLNTLLANEPIVVKNVLKQMREHVVPKGMGAKAGIEAINKFIGALEVCGGCAFFHYLFFFTFFSYFSFFFADVGYLQEVVVGAGGVPVQYGDIEGGLRDGKVKGGGRQSRGGTVPVVGVLSSYSVKYIS